MLKKISSFLIKENLVMFVVLVNSTIFIALDLDPKLVEKTGDWINWIDYGCIVFFILELIIKVKKLGIKLYFKDHWNKLDFFIVVASFPILLEPFFENLTNSFGWARKW
jgi:hypothetical protein